MEEKEIKYEEFDGGVIDAIALYDPEIGITIVAKDNRNIYLHCSHRPGSPKWQDHWDKEDDGVYDHIVDSIEKGYVVGESYRKLLKSDAYGGYVSANSCAFNS